ncbi:unnamed protein product [Arctia plantaginis]|uniref:Shavenoid isoform B-like N-terminal domain-containing protein n=1 Tax=Arctia plantaginis TaxID=874455 RepID=A0A8S1B5I5_ARCPL|nr:unnamed protein product [Arctia plantaginis]
MTNKAILRIGSLKLHEMARILILIVAAGAVGASSLNDQVALTNVTRYATGDYFSLIGSDCGPTRCMELTHGTALATIGTDASGCRCQCRKDTPAFREDHGSCVNHIDECLMASFGRGTSKPQIPYVFLPLKGQIIYPSKEIVFTDVEDAICAVTSAQYLSTSGWVTLRDLVDNDVPFGLYRDEGNTFLQWRGSAALHTRLEGRLIAVHVLCSAAINSRLATSCAAFRIAGAAQNALLDVRSIPFHAGETVTSEVAQRQGLSVLESLAIGVCVLLLVFVYAAGIIFYVHYKQKQKRNQKDQEQNHTNTMSTDNGSLESRIDMSNVMLKTNPLLKLNGMGGDFFHDENIPDVGEHSEDNMDSSCHNTHTAHKFQKLNTNVISAMVHSRRMKTLRPSIRTATSSEKMNERFQRRSMSPDALERAPHSELSIIDCSLENNFGGSRQLPSSNGENAYRKKLYFNPVFFETEHLKNPPPAAIEFLTKIREVMYIAKEKMTSKRFLPILSDIPEEDLYQTIDLGWDIPCARRGRRFSAISLKQENTRKTTHCGGCPGCDSNSQSNKTVALTRSSSCKSCVGEDYKQKIVRKWLDEVPTVTSTSKSTKSIAKISGTPRNIEVKKQETICPKSALESNKILTVTYTKPKNTDIAQTHTEINSIYRDNKDVLRENKSIITESRPTVIELKPKQIEIKPQISEIKPKAAEIIIKGSHDRVLKEYITIENKPEERKIIGKPTNIKQIKVDNESDKMSVSIVTNSEKKTPPSSHTSRRIRKKLPPPPPPPVSLPEPLEEEEEAPIPPEVKVKMEAVIREIKTCRRIDPTETDDEKLEPKSRISPKLVIPVIGADSQYFSDDNVLTLSKKKDLYGLKDNLAGFDNIDPNIIKRRRFSVACFPEFSQRGKLDHSHNLLGESDRVMSTSWRDMRKAVDNSQFKDDKNFNNEEIFVNSHIEPLYDNIHELAKPGSLTIEVRGSPVETRRTCCKDDVDFDPDTLDRRDTKKRIEKILLKSAGSFKYKSTSSESDSCKKSPVEIITRKIGNLREIYEAKAKAQEEEMKFYSRRQSITYGQDLSAFMRSVKAPDLIRHIEGQNDPKPPIPPHQRRGTELSPKSFLASARGSPLGDRRRMSEDRDRFQQYTRLDNLNARRSGRRSARTRSRRTDLRKLYRTEDSGYMSTDSNESKRRARYLMQLRPVKTALSNQATIPTIRAVVTKPLVLQMESDTDDVESLWDGRSESGGESVETDSVFFGNFDDSKEMLAELGLNSFEPQGKIMHTHEQIDSGFMGETNIILSGDSDSEHRSVISITTGHDGRASVASLSNLDDAAYMHTIEC